MATSYQKFGDIAFNQFSLSDTSDSDDHSLEPDGQSKLELLLNKRPLTGVYGPSISLQANQIKEIPNVLGVISNIQSAALVIKQSQRQPFVSPVVESETVPDQQTSISQPIQNNDTDDHEAEDNDSEDRDVKDHDAEDYGSEYHDSEDHDSEDYDSDLEDHDAEDSDSDSEDHDSENHNAGSIYSTSSESSEAQEIGNQDTEEEDHDDQQVPETCMQYINPALLIREDEPVERDLDDDQGSSNDVLVPLGFRIYELDPYAPSDNDPGQQISDADADYQFEIGYRCEFCVEANPSSTHNLYEMEKFLINHMKARHKEAGPILQEEKALWIIRVFTCRDETRYYQDITLDKLDFSAFESQDMTNEDSLVDPPFESSTGDQPEFHTEVVDLTNEDSSGSSEINDGPGLQNSFGLDGPHDEDFAPKLPSNTTPIPKAFENHDEQGELSNSSEYVGDVASIDFDYRRSSEVSAIIEAPSSHEPHLDEEAQAAFIDPTLFVNTAEPIDQTPGSSSLVASRSAQRGSGGAQIVADILSPPAPVVKKATPKSNKNQKADPRSKTDGTTVPQLTWIDPQIGPSTRQGSHEPVLTYEFEQVDPASPTKSTPRRRPARDQLEIDRTTTPSRRSVRWQLEETEALAEEDNLSAVWYEENMNHGETNEVINHPRMFDYNDSNLPTDPNALSVSYMSNITAPVETSSRPIELLECQLCIDEGREPYRDFTQWGLQRHIQQRHVEVTNNGGMHGRPEYSMHPNINTLRDALQNAALAPSQYIPSQNNVTQNNFPERAGPRDDVTIDGPLGYSMVGAEASYGYEGSGHPGDSSHTSGRPFGTRQLDQDRTAIKCCLCINQAVYTGDEAGIFVGSMPDVMKHGMEAHGLEVGQLQVFASHNQALRASDVPELASESLTRLNSAGPSMMSPTINMLNSRFSLFRMGSRTMSPVSWPTLNINMADTERGMPNAETSLGPGILGTGIGTMNAGVCPGSNMTETGPDLGDSRSANPSFESGLNNASFDFGGAGTGLGNAMYQFGSAGTDFSDAGLDFNSGGTNFGPKFGNPRQALGNPRLDFGSTKLGSEGSRTVFGGPGPAFNRPRSPIPVIATKDCPPPAPRKHNPYMSMGKQHSFEEIYSMGYQSGLMQPRGLPDTATGSTTGHVGAASTPPTRKRGTHDASPNSSRSSSPAASKAKRKRLNPRSKDTNAGRKKNGKKTPKK